MLGSSGSGLKVDITAIPAGTVDSVSENPAGDLVPGSGYQYTAETVATSATTGSGTDLTLTTLLQWMAVE